MPSHGDGKTNSRVQLVLPDALHERVAKLAEESDLSVSHFIRRILTEAAAKDIVYPAHAGVFEDQAKYPKKKAK